MLTVVMAMLVVVVAMLIIVVATLKLAQSTQCMKWSIVVTMVRYIVTTMDHFMH